MDCHDRDLVGLGIEMCVQCALYGVRKGLLVGEKSPTFEVPQTRALVSFLLLPSSVRLGKSFSLPLSSSMNSRIWFANPSGLSGELSNQGRRFLGRLCLNRNGHFRATSAAPSFVDMEAQALGDEAAWPEVTPREW